MSGPVAVDDSLLRGWPLPEVEEDGDKESRGRVVVLAGSREMPGAAILAGTAALRAGAGKLVIATVQSAAQTVAAAMPEARVIALPEASDGAPTFYALPLLQPLQGATAALVIGPGMTGTQSTLSLVQALLPMFRDATVLLDALAMDCVRTSRGFEQPVILTPHAGEMAHLTDAHKAQIEDDSLQVALRQARAWNAVVALKGRTTNIVAPDGTAWSHTIHAPGLGTSGSGDVLAGLIAGLAARGAPPAQAAVWGVALHARAGRALAERHGTVGYLAREIAAEVPAVMEAFL